MGLATYEVLEKALALIEDEKNWCQGMERTAAGRRCARGALCEVAQLRDLAVAQRVLGRFANPRESSVDAIINFNDLHNHAEVVELFQRAVRAEKEKEGIPVEIPEQAKEPVS